MTPAPRKDLPVMPFESAGAWETWLAGNRAREASVEAPMMQPGTPKDLRVHGIPHPGARRAPGPAGAAGIQTKLLTAGDHEGGSLVALPRWSVS